MILVTLGSQDKQFTRLLDSVEKQIELGNISEKVVVQAGYTPYQSDKMEIFDLIDHEKFEQLVKDSDLIITHGGAGSILTGIKNDKKVIACPRLAKYEEHVNDHQIQLINQFYNAGYILKYEEDDDLADILKKVNDFKPKKFVSNTLAFEKIIKDFIDNN